MLSRVQELKQTVLSQAGECSSALFSTWRLVQLALSCPAAMQEERLHCVSQHQDMPHQQQHA